MKKILGLIAVILLLAVPAFATHNPEEIYKRALKEYNLKHYAKAAELFKVYAKDHPEAAVYYRIGYSLYKLGNDAEANKYFDYSYAINPDFTPGPYEKKVRSSEPTMTSVPPEAATTAPAKTPTPAPAPAKVATPAPVTAKAETPVPAPAKAVNAPTAQSAQTAPVLAPKPAPPAPKPIPATPMPPVTVPSAGMAAFGMAIIFAIFGAIAIIYLLTSFFLFKIAKKLDVPSPWMAWVPILQIVPMIRAAGKPLWWIILLLIPIINIVAIVLVWMSIAERLGKNRLIGVLMLLPVINFIVMGYLAFAQAPSYTAGMTPFGDKGMGEDSSDLPNIDDFKFTDEPTTPDNEPSGFNSTSSDFDRPSTSEPESEPEADDFSFPGDSQSSFKEDSDSTMSMDTNDFNFNTTNDADTSSDDFSSFSAPAESSDDFSFDTTDNSEGFPTDFSLSESEDDKKKK